MTQQRRIIVAGAQGVTGRAAALWFAGQPDTTVYGLSRRAAAGIPGVEEVSVDLLDPDDAQTTLSRIEGITHLVFAAYVEKPTAAEKTVVNVALLRNLLDAVEPGSPGLRHVTFYQGGKAYGADLGPFKTPAREDDPRLMPPNFYYDQEDLLRARGAGRWSFTALRPEAICGYGVGNPMNLAMVIAIYATLSKELGLPLRYPGTEAAYRALYQVTSADILAEATDWAGRSDAAQDQVFNITNGDQFRWQHMWPRIAAMFGMDYADPVPMPLASYMADKGPVWARIVEKHGLQPVSYDALVSWAFGDFIFNSGFDNVSSTIKARRAGFGSCIDTEHMFRSFFDRLRQDRVIPPS